MLNWNRLSATLILLSSCLLPVPLAAQFPKVTYRIRTGSNILDECPTCERPIDPQYGVSGTLILERLPVRIAGELYAISALTLVTADFPGAFIINGGGQLYRRSPETQATTLTLSANGVDGIVLESPVVAPPAPWPAIDVTVSEDGARDPNHKLTLRIIAAPDVEQVPYELVKGNLADGSGSVLEVVCPPCVIPDFLVPLEGTLSVGLIDAVADGLSTYLLDAIALKSLLPEAKYEIFGSGTYQEGGDLEMQKQMRLTLGVRGWPLHELLGGPVPVKPGAAFPVIDLQVEETSKNGFLYRLHLVAKPLPGSFFRRGDANSDGGVDLADAVFHLLWRFASGPTPSCLEAADSNDDGLHDVTDAVFTLSYLFLGGPAPPAPGPIMCGNAPQPTFDCSTQPPCMIRG